MSKKVSLLCVLGLSVSAVLIALGGVGVAAAAPGPVVMAYYQPLHLGFLASTLQYTYPASVAEAVTEMSAAGGQILPVSSVQVYVGVSLGIFFLFMLFRRSLHLGGR